MRPLVLLLIASLVLPSATAGVAAWAGYRNTIDGALGRATEMARVLREHALRTFEAQSIAIDWVDTRLGDRSWTEIQQSAEIHDLLRRIADGSPHIDGLWLIRPEGFTVNSADFFPMPGTDVREREYFHVLREQNTLHLGEMIRGYLKGTLNFNIARRRSPRDGDFNGIIMVTSSLSYYEDFWKQVLPPNFDVLGIMREDGRFVVRWPGFDRIPERVPEYSPFYGAIKASAVGSYETRSLADGVERIYGYAKLGAFPAYMVVGTAKEAVLVPWRRQTFGFVIAAALITLALTGTTLMALRRERRLFQEVERRKRVETTLMAKEEHLEAMRRAETALRASEQRFRTLFDSLLQGVVFIDREGRITNLNPASESLFGIPAADALGHTPDELGLTLVDADGTPLPPDRKPSAIVLRSGMLLNGVLIGVDQRGNENGRRWLMADAIPLRRPAEEEPSSACVLFSDITEKRRAEDAQRILMREVDHRAKNALAVAQALVRLTRPGDSHEDFVGALEGRIAALARAHTLLARSHWRGALLRGILEEELEPYRARRGEHIILEGPPVTLDPYAAQPLGMVVHELATNAAKHGALSVPEGHLTIRWRLDPSERQALIIDWAESAGPAVTPPQRRGFGSDLIAASVTSQLAGTVDFDWSASGLRVRLSVPLTSVREGRPSDQPDGHEATSPSDFCPVPKGLRVLVVEDNALVAMQMVQYLRDAGCATVGPAATVERAVFLAESEHLDAAVLDVDLQGQAVFPAAEALAARGVPFLFATGFSEIDTPAAAWPEAPHLRKPIDETQLMATILRLSRTREVATPSPT